VRVGNGGPHGAAWGAPARLPPPPPTLPPPPPLWGVGAPLPPPPPPWPAYRSHPIRPLPPLLRQPPPVSLPTPFTHVRPTTPLSSQPVSLVHRPGPHAPTPAPAPEPAPPRQHPRCPPPPCGGGGGGGGADAHWRAAARLLSSRSIVTTTCLAPFRVAERRERCAGVTTTTSYRADSLGRAGCRDAPAPCRWRPATSAVFTSTLGIMGGKSVCSRTLMV